VTAAIRALVRRSPLGPFARRLRDAVVKVFPRTNSAFCWVKAGEGVATRIYLYNYWAENYGIPRPRTHWTIHRADGRRVSGGTLVLEPHALRVVDVNAVLAEAGVATPFEGNFVIHLSDRRLRRGVPLQMWGEYRSAGDAISCVHGQWGFYEPWRQRGPTGGHIRVVADARYETFIVPQNCAKSGAGSAPEFMFYRADGAGRRAVGEPIPPRGFARYSVRDLVADGAVFLGDAGGNATVRMTTPSIRTFHFHRHRDGSISVNHGAGDYASALTPVPPLPRAQVEAFGRGPLAVAIAWEGAGVHTRYVLHNNLWPVAPHAFEVRINALGGRRVWVTAEPVVVGPRETRVLPLADFLSAAGVGPEFRGVAEVALAVPARECASGFQLVTELWAGDRMAASDVGSDLFNAPKPGRTRIFARVLEDANFETFVFLAYPAHDPDVENEVTVDLTLVAGNGRARLETSTRIPVHGASFESIGVLFPDAREFLASSGGAGTVKVRCTTARLFGYHVVRQKRSGTLACDHLIGG
jgi:hypothetical protein